MDDITTELEDRMYGFNYAPAFGYCVLPAGKAPDVAQAAIVRAYPNVDPTPLHPSSAAELWADIGVAFEYRGDFAAGHRPSYPVFWWFHFVVLNSDSEGLFIWGSASD